MRRKTSAKKTAAKKKAAKKKAAKKKAAKKKAKKKAKKEKIEARGVGRKGKRITIIKFYLSNNIGGLMGGSGSPISNLAFIMNILIFHQEQHPSLLFFLPGFQEPI